MIELYKRKPMNNLKRENLKNTMEIFIEKCIKKNKKIQISRAMNSLYQFISIYLKKNFRQEFSSKVAFKMLF